MSIQERQNQPRALGLLAAQRYLYSRAKMFRNVTIAVVLVAAILSLVASVIDNKHFAQSLTVFVLLSWAFDQLVLAAKERAARTEAATIQEAFDCFVLDLSWPSYKGIQPPTEDRIRQLTTRAKKKHTRSLENWHQLNDIPDDPILARLHCQRTNFWWDVNLRNKWITSIQIIFCVLLALLVLLSVPTGLTVAKLLAILTSNIRVLAWGLNERASQASAIKRLNGIHSFLSKSPERTPPSIADVRGIQDTLFEHRCSAPPIPDRFYWWHRPRQEREAGGGLDS